MSPRIRFVRGVRGQRIAYAVDGEGPLLLFPAWWVSHVERDLDDPGFRALFTRLAQSRTVVRYDRPGVGLSDRDRGELSLQDELSTLEIVADACGGDRLALFGGSSGGPPAIAYAAKHTDRTSHLVLFGSYCAGARIARDDVKQAMTALVRASWGLGSKALLDLFAPNHTSEERQRFAALQRDSASAEMAADLLSLTYSMDVSELAAQVRAPTLVLHRKEDRAIPFEQGRDVASRIPGAIFIPLPGDAHLPWIGDFGRVADLVLAFLAGEEPRSSVANAFVREGEVWNLVFDGRRCHLKHARGLSDLALLLARPGEEISAAQLMDGGEIAPTAPEPVLDERARAQVRERLQALDERIAQAEAAGNQPASLAASSERESLLRELRSATGLGGRRRALPDASERARKAVSGRIRESIEKIRLQLPELARHLDESITTGSSCAYRPGQAVSWQL